MPLSLMSPKKLSALERAFFGDIKLFRRRNDGFRMTEQIETNSVMFEEQRLLSQDGKSFYGFGIFYVFYHGKCLGHFQRDEGGHGAHRDWRILFVV